MTAAGVAAAAKAREDGDHAKDLALLSAAHATSQVQSALYPLILPQAMQALGFGYAQIGLLVGLTGLVGGLLQGIHGWVSRWLRRKALCGGGQILLGLSLILSGVAGSFSTFLGLGITGSIGASPHHPIGASLLADWYRRERRAGAFAVHFSGGNLGTVITPLAAGFLLTHIGWRHILMLFGIPGIIVGVLFWLLVDDRRSSGTWHNPAEGKRRTPYLAAGRNPNVIGLVVSRALSSGGRGLGIMLTYVPLYLLSGLHFRPSTAGAYAAVLAAGSVLAPPLAGRVADHLGRRKPVILSSLWISALAAAGLVLTGSRPLGILAVLIVLSLAVYNESALSQTLLADIVSDEERDGAFSLYFVVSFTATALWGAAIGLVIARWQFAAGFALMVASYLLGSAAMFFVRETPAAA